MISGSHQTLTINTNPPGAVCQLIREGVVIGKVPSTPGSVVVERSKYEIIIECERVGHQKTTAMLGSWIEGLIYAAPPLPGWGSFSGGLQSEYTADSASGFDKEYPANTTITLSPEMAPPDVAPAAGP
jgi:hypothetical protein